jgi:23S rRNA maturation-related 3'-5' exoribonuclease YhaM
LRWILRDSARLSAFNTNIIGRIGGKRGNGLVIAKREDFEELKEGEVLDIMGLASLFSSQNVKKIIEIQLTKRNLAAHPSLVVIEGPQADDTITSLVSNVVLTFK